MANLEGVARSILAGLGNDSPSASQLTAMEAWIMSEKPASGTDAYSNNPLNVTLGNLTASLKAGFLPQGFDYSVPDPSQNRGNPVLQFPDLTSGVIATIAALKQSFAARVRTLLATPGDISIATFAGEVGASGWGTPAANIVSNAQSVNPNTSLPNSDGQTVGGGGSAGPGSGGSDVGHAPDPCGGLSGSQYILCRIQNMVSGPFQGVQSITSWVTNGANWWKLGLSLVGVVMIGAGIAIYVKPHLTELPA